MNQKTNESEVKKGNEEIFQLRKLSVTQIEMFLRCEFSWFCRYVRGLKIPPGSALTFGGAFDDGISANYEYKIKKEKDMPLKEVQEVFASSFEERAKETDWIRGENPGQIKDEGIQGIDVFHKEICPTVKPEAVQMDKWMEFENSEIGFQGKIDVIETDKTISDTKTTGRIWSPGDELKKKQPVAYSLLLDRDSQHQRLFRYDILVRTKKPKTQRVPLIVGPEERNGFLILLASIIKRIETSIKDGIFLPRQDHFLCNRRHCGYANLCEKTFKWKIKD